MFTLLATKASFVSQIFLVFATNTFSAIINFRKMSTLKPNEQTLSSSSKRSGFTDTGTLPRPKKDSTTALPNDESAEKVSSNAEKMATTELNVQPTENADKSTTTTSTQSMDPIDNKEKDGKEVPKEEAKEQAKKDPGNF